MLLRSEQDGELWVTMHTHPRGAITQSLNTVPSLRRRQQLARTNPLLYVPSLADVNNMLRYGMHASIVRRRPSQCPSSAAAPLWGGAWSALGGSALPGGEIGALGAQPVPRLLERAACKVADSAAPVHPGTCTSSSRLSIGSFATCLGRARPPSWIGTCRPCWPRAKATSRCGLGQTSPNPVLTALERFRPAFEARISASPPHGRRRSFDLSGAVREAEGLAGRPSAHV